MPDTPDPIADAVLSDSAYDQIRHTEGVITLPVHRALLWQAALLALLGTILPLYALYPSTVAAYVPTLDPFLAAPKLLLLGIIGLVTEVVAALLLSGLWLYRQRHAPLCEETARTVYDVEQIVTGLSVVTGGLAIVITVVLVSVGVFGEGTIAVYLEEVAGEDVFRQSATGVSIGDLAATSMVSSAAVLVLRQFITAEGRA